MLVINLSYTPKHLEDFIELRIKENPAVILDFASTFLKNNAHQVIYPSDIDNHNKIHQSALKNYVFEMGNLSQASLKNLSKKDVRSYVFYGLPLYWLTDISEKHPQNCVLKNLYYFKYLHKLLNYKGDEIAFVLPTSASHFISAINSFIRNHLPEIKKIEFNIEPTKVHSLRTNISYLKNFYKKIEKTRSGIRPSFKDNASIQNLIFSYVPQTWRDDLQADYVLKDIYSMASHNKKHTKYIPYYFDYNHINNQTISQKWDTNLFDYFPSKFQIIQFHVKVFKLILSIKRIELKEECVSFVNSEVIKQELNILLKDKTEFLFNYLWLTNYFSSIKYPVNVFYQDEFYPQGRIISAAIKKSGNTNIKSYGVQHGIFYEAHTVYSISNTELAGTSKNNGMPIPDNFIVWGKYFKKHFLKYNSSNPDYVIVAGNPAYLKNLNETKETVQKSTHELVLLWCTTIKIDFINQYKNVISNFVKQNSKVKIIIRCHPQVNIKDFIKSQIVEPESKQFSFSNDISIQEAFKSCDAVLTSSGSTVFLDAMIAGKPIFNLVNNDYYMGDLGEKEMIKIFTDDDLSKAIEELMKKEFKPTSYSELLHTDSSNWKLILN